MKLGTNSLNLTTIYHIDIQKSIESRWLKCSDRGHCKISLQMANIFLLFIFIPSFILAQNTLIVEHQLRPRVTKQLPLGIYYTVTTKDTVYKSEIITFSDSTLSVVRWLKSGRDTTYRNIQSTRRSKDTVITRPILIRDTTIISFSDVSLIQKDRFQNQNTLFFIPAMLLPLAALGILGLPFAAIINQGESFEDYAIVEGGLIAASVPFIIIGSSKIKYDTLNKWKIKSMPKKIR